MVKPCINFMTQIYFKKYILLGVAITAIFVGYLFGNSIFAGSITPSVTPPAPTFYTMQDIYSKLTNPSYVYQSHGLDPTASSGITSMHSIDDIYNAIPTYIVLTNSTTSLPAGLYGTTTLSSVETNLIARNITNGVTVFGITGTY